MRLLLLLAFTLVLTPMGYSGGMVSKYLSVQEAYGSTHKSIPNVPSIEQKAAIKKVAIEHFDLLRELARSPLYISSVYRSPALNEAVGGAKNSDHMVTKDSKGFYTVAIDIDNDGKGGISNQALFMLILNMDYFKAICEFPVFGADGKSLKPSWDHVSFSTDPTKNKIKKTYIALKVGNRTIYKDFKTYIFNNL